jgi:hypothetical protein
LLCRVMALHFPWVDQFNGVEVSAKCKDVLGPEFAARVSPWDAVMCAVYCTPREGGCITSLTIPAREINNQVSLLPLPFPLLGLIKNSSVTTLQLSRSERLRKRASVLLAQALKKKKKEYPG